MKNIKEKGTQTAKKEFNRTLRTLKKEESYSPLFGCQVEIVSVLKVLFWRLAEELLDNDIEYIETITSREGNERYKQNPKYQLFIQLLDRYQDALKALGMNVDSKPVKRKEKGIDDFLNNFRDDD